MVSELCKHFPDYEADLVWQDQLFRQPGVAAGQGTAVQIIVKLCRGYSLAHNIQHVLTFLVAIEALYSICDNVHLFVREVHYSTLQYSTG